MAKVTGLTTNRIKGLKPKETQYYEWDVTGKRGQGRLGVRVNTSGERVFVYRYFADGKAKFIQLECFLKCHWNKQARKPENLLAC